jgi:putative addiction module component (TIGR02574 family)
MNISINIKEHHMKPTEIPEINKLSVPEKILFMEDLWDSITINESEIPIPESHKEELDRRYKTQLKSPGELLTLKELQKRIENNK